MLIEQQRAYNCADMKIVEINLFVCFTKHSSCIDSMYSDAYTLTKMQKKKLEISFLSTEFKFDLKATTVDI